MTDLTARRPAPPQPRAVATSGVFGRIGSVVIRRRRAVLLAAILAFLVGGGIGVTAFGKLKTGGFTDPHSGSSQASHLLDQRFGGAANVVLLVHGTRGSVDTEAVKQLGTRAASLLVAVPGV